MSLNDLIGRRVRVIAWEHLKHVAYYLRRTREHGDSLEGTVTHVEACGEGADEGDVWVQIDGLARESVFGLYQLKVLPLTGASHQCNSSRRVRCSAAGPEESLMVDGRSAVTPAQMVESKLEALLQGG
jgi:hypothetical protein